MNVVPYLLAVTAENDLPVGRLVLSRLIYRCVTFIIHTAGSGLNSRCPELTVIIDIRIGGFFIDRHIIIVAVAVIAAPVGLVVDLTKMEVDLFGRSYPVIAIKENKTHLCIAVRGLNLPDNGFNGCR